jgi:hypothetical protein
MNYKPEPGRAGNGTIENVGDRQESDHPSRGAVVGWDTK